MRLLQYPAFTSLILLLNLGACDNSQSPQPDFAWWNTEFYAQWSEPGELKLCLRYHDDCTAPLNTYIRAEYDVYLGPSIHGPWTKIWERKAKYVQLEQYTIDVAVSDPTKMAWFYVESKFYVDDELFKDYKGPFIATTQPLMTAENWQTLPDLSVSTGTDYMGRSDIEYCATAVSPDGKHLFSDGHARQIHDLQSGTEIQVAQWQSGEECSWQGIAEWKDDIIFLLTPTLFVIDTDEFKTLQSYTSEHSFFIDDSKILLIDGENWNVLDWNNMHLTPGNPSFDLTTSVATITYDPISQQYGANSLSDSRNTWYLLDSTFNVKKMLNPVAEMPQNYRPLEYYWDSARPRLLGMYWLPNGLVMMQADWSGRPEYWLYNTRTESYHQITGYAKEYYPGEAQSWKHYPLLPILNPAWDSFNNRVLFFFATDETHYAVRAYTPPG